VDYRPPRANPRTLQETHKKGLSPEQPLRLGNALDTIRLGEPDLSAYDALPRKTLDPGAPPSKDET
jgi:hypothetical protein